MEKLKELLDTYDEKRAPEGSINVRLLSALRDCGQMKREQIAIRTGFDKKKLGWYLKSLRQKGMIEITERIYTSNGSYFVYGITESGTVELTNESGTL